MCSPRCCGAPCSLPTSADWSRVAMDSAGLPFDCRRLPPDCHRAQVPRLAVPATTSLGRPLLVPLWSLPLSYRLLAALPAAFLAVLFFLDQVNCALINPNRTCSPRIATDRRGSPRIATGGLRSPLTIERVTHSPTLASASSHRTSPCAPSTALTTSSSDAPPTTSTCSCWPSSPASPPSVASLGCAPPQVRAREG